MWIAANAKVPYGYDELSYAGAIKGSPVDLIKCETVDFDVPANAEIIIEGELGPPFELGVEGPWPEYLRYSRHADQPSNHGRDCGNFQNQSH